jgi:hypothetical protein
VNPDQWAALGCLAFTIAILLGLRLLLEVLTGGERP